MTILSLVKYLPAEVNPRPATEENNDDIVAKCWKRGSGVCI